MAYVYILYSKTLDRFYIGHTSTSVEDRLVKHLQKHKGFTATVKDWEIVYTEEFPDKIQAYARERKIKSWKSKQKIRELIKKSICGLILANCDQAALPVAQIYAALTVAAKKPNAHYRVH